MIFTKKEISNVLEFSDYTLKKKSYIHVVKCDETEQIQSTRWSAKTFCRHAEV